MLSPTPDEIAAIEKLLEWAVTDPDKAEFLAAQIKRLYGERERARREEGDDVA